MVKPLTGLLVFFASPSGLKEERQLFKKIIWDYNEERALEVDVVFIPVMCEQMTGGPGQAQGRINRRIEDCDYCITMFCDDLGSPREKGSPRGSKSVTDGEYRKALKLKKEGKMKDVLLFFKEIPLSQRNDPGKKLEALIEYKKQKQKDCTYIEFASKSEFEKEVNKHLFKWLMENTPAGRLKGPSTGVSDYEKPPESITESS